MLYTPPNKDLELASLKRELAARNSLKTSNMTMTKKKGAKREEENVLHVRYNLYFSKSIHFFLKQKIFVINNYIFSGERSFALSS